MDNEPTPTLEAIALLRELAENWASETFVPATYPALTPDNADFTRAVEEKTNAVMGKFNALVIMMASNAEDEQIASALRHAVRTCVRDLIVPENSTLKYISTVPVEVPSMRAFTSTQHHLNNSFNALHV